MKACLKCNTCKNEDKFRLRYFPKRGKSYRNNTCKACEIKYNLECYHRIKSTDLYKAMRERRKIATKKSGYHKKRYKMWGRNYKLKTTFGITQENYKKMLLEQKGVCAICRQPETSRVDCSDGKKIRPLSIDHNHKTGKVRELLCNKCNIGIARFDENIQFLAKAISYLQKHKEENGSAGAITGA